MSEYAEGNEGGIRSNGTEVYRRIETAEQAFIEEQARLAELYDTNSVSVPVAVRGKRTKAAHAAYGRSKAVNTDSPFKLLCRLNSGYGDAVELIHRLVSLLPNAEKPRYAQTVNEGLANCWSAYCAGKMVEAGQWARGAAILAGRMFTKPSNSVNIGQYKALPHYHYGEN